MASASASPAAPPAAARPAARPQRRSASTIALRVVGWTLIAMGAVVLLYLAYSLWFTGFETARAQSELQQRWQAEVAVPGDGEAGDDVDAPDPAADDEGDEAPADDGAGVPQSDDREAAGGSGVGEAVAMLEFARPGSGERPVSDEPLFIVEGTSYADLTRGPGQYVSSADPGEDGNFAVAGHRTTYGSPFFHLDQLRPGDEVHVTDPRGARHVYRVVEQRVVAPTAAWVLGPDPLDLAAPTLTLTTCHPRFSAAQRMIVFAELVS